MRMRFRPGQFECWDLLRLVYRQEHGIDLPHYGAEVGFDDERGIVQVARREIPRWDRVPMRASAGQQVPHLREFDVFYMVALHQAPTHVALYAGRGEALEVVARGVRLNRVATPDFWPRVRSVHRHPELA